MECKIILYSFVKIVNITFMKLSKNNNSDIETLVVCYSFNWIYFTYIIFGLIYKINVPIVSGLQWNEFFTPISYHDQFQPGHVALMLILDSILYMLVAMYVEKIRPGMYGVPLPWYFPFTKSFWCPNKTKVAGEFSLLWNIMEQICFYNTQNQMVP